MLEFAILFGLVFYLLIPALVYGWSASLAPKLCKLPPFLFGGIWYLRTVLVTYLFPLFLGGAIGAIVYSAIVFLIGGIFGFFCIPHKLLRNPGLTGFEMAFLVYVLSFVIAIQTKARPLMEILDPANYPPLPESYAGADGGPIGYLLGGVIILALGAPLMFIYMICIFVAASKRLADETYSRTIEFPESDESDESAESINEPENSFFDYGNWREPAAKGALPGRAEASELSDNAGRTELVDQQMKLDTQEKESAELLADRE